MEEVDNIIIHSLRQIGCDISEVITNLSNFSPEIAVEATAKCLETIRPGLGLSPSLPASMAARFRMGAALAQACMDLGYKGDIGYQTFLYSSETDLRRVLMFLIEKLPKESDKVVDEPASEITLLERSIASAVSESLSSPWVPHFCHSRETKFIGRTKYPFETVKLDVPSTSKDDKDYLTYCEKYQKSILEQVSDGENVLPSILSYNAKKLHSVPTNILERIEWMNSQRGEKNLFSTTVSNITTDALNPLEILPQQKEPPSPSEQLSQVEQSSMVKKEETHHTKAEKLEKECKSLRIDIDQVQIEMKKLNTKLSQLTSTAESELQEFNQQEEQRKIVSKAYDLLEDGENNIKKLEQVIEANTNKLVSLANQWEKHRLPLIQSYRKEREKHSSIANASRKKIDEFRILKEKERELVEEIRNKEQQFMQLATKVKKLPKETSRSAYTQRILEIINNVRKQKDEITKVLNDTRHIKKEINTLSGRLERSFTVVDELIFRDARINETSKKAYRLLATLHSDCSELVDLVEVTGAIIREIRDLEEQIDTESAKNVSANLERITADLTQMRQETAILTTQLKNKKS